MMTVAPANDPLWKDTEYRTALLRSTMIDFHIKSKALSELMGVDYNLVRHWKSGKYRTIPIANLRALLYDLQARGV
jgi:DNA-binding Xre family transcriptional regulator